MARIRHAALVGSAITLLLLVFTPADAMGQGKGKEKAEAASSGVEVTFSVDLKTQIRDYYSAHASGAEALPPGMRRRLARGKPLPPGIAKKAPPPELHDRLAIPQGYEVVEVGLDVLLVEVATSIVHDVLMDVIR